MNPFAYRTTGLVIKAIENLSKANINIHGSENIPEGSLIFVINHFTRIETFLMPYNIFKLTGKPVWSLASSEFFQGAAGAFLEKVGALSNKDPDRDRLIVKTLLTGEADWIIFPEGRMVKNKKIIEKGRFMITWAGGKRPPHTGAATLALRTEFYRQRMRRLSEENSDEVNYLMDLFQIDSLEPVVDRNTAVKLVDDIPDRLIEEIMTEGSMLISGVDIDIRFGKPIEVFECLQCSAIDLDISSKERIDFDDPIPSKKPMRIEAVRLMENYMGAIYDLTTVNHDHLFASMLRSMPSRKMDEMDLRRRVFLTTLRIRDNTGIHFHHSLEEDQLHLLTDDRFHKVRDFLSVATDTGIVKKADDETTLIKDSSKFSSPYDFHRARIDNPVEVMANAVEPLSELQRRVRRLASLPRFWIRRRVAKRIMQAAVEEYQDDYKQFYIEGESKPMGVGMPLLVKGKSRDIGVVLSHGYMAAPLEVTELARYLGRLGFWVYVPRLKGHATSPEDLATRTYQDWQRSVDQGYAIISSLCKRVVAGGFSTGAGLALDLAARVDSVIGVFAVSAPMRLKDFSSRFAPAVDMWNRFMERARQVGAKKEFVENKPENPHINYMRNPISGVVELERLMDDLEPKLPDLMVPSLVVQSKEDPVVDPEGSRQVFDLIGSKDKEYVLFNFDRHGILLGDGSQRVHKTIGAFIKQLR
jgi:esterase/lipase/1-acyl-sn-glycerol-3-phosphate acyltransferase